MAPKPKQGEVTPQPEKTKPAAVTYYARRVGNAYEVHRVDVFDAESGPRLVDTRVVDHPNRLVARERHRVLLEGPEVML